MVCAALRTWPTNDDGIAPCFDAFCVTLDCFEPHDRAEPPLRSNGLLKLSTKHSTMFFLDKHSLVVDERKIIEPTVRRHVLPANVRVRLGNKTGFSF